MRKIFRQLCFWAAVVAGICTMSTAQEEQKQLPAPSTQNGQTLDANEISVRLARVTRDWLKNKISTPGATAEVREIERQRGNGNLRIDYHVFVKGVPKDQLYELQQWPITARQPSELMTGLSIAPNGMMICAGREPGQCQGEKLDDDVALTVVNPAKGEPFRWVLVSGDNKTKIFLGVIPDPISEKNKGCTLEVIRLMPKFELAMIRASGYKPNEELKLESKSYDEAHDAETKSDSDGEYVAALLPNVEGKQAGKTDVTLKGAACAPKLSFEWGR